MTGHRPKGMPKTGGRVKGTPNKPRAELVVLLNDRWPGFNAVVELAAIANDPETDIDRRIDCLKAVARHTVPTMRSIEHKGAVTTRAIIDLDSEAVKSAARSLSQVIVDGAL